MLASSTITNFFRCRMRSEAEIRSLPEVTLLLSKVGEPTEITHTPTRLVWDLPSGIKLTAIDTPSRRGGGERYLDYGIKTRKHYIFSRDVAEGSKHIGG